MLYEMHAPTPAELVLRWRSHQLRAWRAGALLLVVAGACTFPSYTVDQSPAVGGVGATGGGGAGATGGAFAAGTEAVTAGTGAGELGGSPTAGAAGDEGVAGSTDERGTALAFMGHQMLRVGKPPTESFTIEMWLRTTMVVGGPQWFNGAALFVADAGGLHDDWGAALLDGKFGFGTGDPDVTCFSVSPINLGDWTHVAGTRDMTDGVLRVYVNGELEATLSSGNTTPMADVTPAWIGGNYEADFYNGLEGTIDEMRLWSVARSAEELKGNLHVRLVGDEPGLFAYWRFDDGSGLTATDSSGHGQDAVLGDGHADQVPQWVRYAPPALP